MFCAIHSVLIFDVGDKVNQIIRHTMKNRPKKGALNMSNRLRSYCLCALSLCLMFFCIAFYTSDAHSGWRDTLRHTKSNFSRSYQQKKKNFSRKYQQKKRNFRRRYQQNKRSATNRMQQAKNNLEKRIRKSKALGYEAKKAAKKTLSRLGVSAGQAVTSFLEKTKGRGAKVVEKATPIMQHIKRKVRDPEVQRRAMVGVLVAAGTAAAIYKHKDDIQYRLASEGMRRVKIPVNGQMRSVEDVYSEAILKKAPYLRGTAIAEDPAQILAYGVAATAKKDLLNNIDIVPNGRGGLTSVNSAVINATGADQGLAALQIGDTIEGMSVEAARSGQLGYNAQIFAAAYSGASEKIEGGY
ncbi:MAG: hypothetical protein JRJ69_14050 [Deltaproteobacteria bacterium]|nr:hypothetical protein [Deltaproteobacteria bacterium]